MEMQAGDRWAGLDRTEEGSGTKLSQKAVPVVCKGWDGEGLLKELELWKAPKEQWR